MKLKYSICAVVFAASMAFLPQSTLAVEAPISGAPGAEMDAAPTVVYEEVTPQLEHAAEVNEDEQVIIPEDTLIDLILPDTLNSETITRIGEGCFQGCEVIRSVTIPATVTEIGADAFADCPYLEVIYFADRADAENLTLGENWNGDAEVEFLLVAVEEDEQQSETDPDAEPAAPSEEEAPVDDPNAAEPSENVATESTAPAEPKDEQSQSSEGTTAAADVDPSDEPSEPTGGATGGTEPPSDAPVAEEPAVGDDAAAGEGTPPSDPQPSEPSEPVVDEPAPADEPAE